MQAIVNDPRFFVQTTPSTSTATWNSADKYGSAVALVKSMLGDEFPVQRPIGLKKFKQDSVFDVMSTILPNLSEQSAFFWDRFVRPMSSLLETSNYREDCQCKYIVWLYSRLDGFLGPVKRVEGQIAVCVDGSTGEPSWIIPANQQEGSLTGELRFCMAPAHPESGKLLRASAVMEYLVANSLGLISYQPGDLDWARKTEEFLYPDNVPEEDLAPELSRTCLAFVFKEEGGITVKAYYQSATINNAPKTKLSPIYVGNSNFDTFNGLIEAIDPSMNKPYEMVLNYFDSLEPHLKPVFHLLAVDITRHSKNRLKIYGQVRRGLTFNDVIRGFTLGGYLNSPSMDESLEKLAQLWDYLFPTTNSTSGLEPIPATAIDQKGKNLKEVPVGAFLYYYELTPGKTTISPKVYFPVRHYCADDLTISTALENFYTSNGITWKGAGPKDGWVAGALSKSFSHRPLSKKTGIVTWVSFGHKGGEWEVTSYLSPEMWLQ